MKIYFIISIMKMDNLSGTESNKAKFVKGDFVEIVGGTCQGLFGQICNSTLGANGWTYYIPGYGIGIPENQLEQVTVLPKFRLGMKVRPIWLENIGGEIIGIEWIENQWMYSISLGKDILTRSANGKYGEHELELFSKFSIDEIVTTNYSFSDICKVEQVFAMADGLFVYKLKGEDFLFYESSLYKWYGSGHFNNS